MSGTASSHLKQVGCSLQPHKTGAGLKFPLQEGGEDFSKGCFFLVPEAACLRSKLHAMLAGVVLPVKATRGRGQERTESQFPSCHE